MSLWFVSSSSVIPASSSSVIPASSIAAARKLPCGLFPLHQSFLPAPLLQQENSLVVCFLFISHSCQLHCCSKKTPLWFVSSSSVIPASSIAAARKLPCGLFPLHQSFLPAPLLQQENSLVVCFLFISHSCQLHCCSKKTPLWFVSSSSVIPASSIAAARKLPCGLFPLHQSFLPAPLLQQENSLVVCFLFISHSCQLHCCSKKTPLWCVSSSSVIPASSIAAARKLPCGLFPLHQSFLPAPLLQQENSLVVCFLFISHSCQLHCCSKKTPLWFVSSSSVIPASSIAAARKLPCGLFPLHQSFLPAPLLQQENSLVVCFLFISHSCQLHCCSKKTPLWFVSSSSVIPASSIAAARKLPCGVFPLHQSFLPAPLLQQENSLVVCFLFISHSCQLHCCSKKTPLWFVSSSSVIPASSIAAARKLPCGLFPLHQSFLPAPLLQQENSLVVCFLFISHSCQLHCCSKKTPLWFVSSSSVIPASSIAAARKLPCGVFPLHQSFLPAPLLQQENSLVVCFLFISHSCQLHCCSKKTPLWCVSSSSVIPASSIAAARKLPCGLFPLHQSFLPAPLLQQENSLVVCFLFISHSCQLHCCSKKTPLWCVSSSSVIPASSIAAARKLPCGLFPLHQSFLPAPLLQQENSLVVCFLFISHSCQLHCCSKKTPLWCVSSSSVIPASSIAAARKLPCGVFPLHQSFLPAPLLQQENSLVVCFLFISHSCQLHCCSKKTPLWCVSSSSVIPASSIAAARKLPCGVFPLHQSFLPAPLLQQENSLVVCFLFISHSCQLHCCSKKTPLWFVSSSSVIPASSIAAARKLPCGLFPLHQSFLPAPLLQQENSLVVCFLFISHSCQLHCCSKKTPLWFVSSSSVIPASSIAAARKLPCGLFPLHQSFLPAPLLQQENSLAWAVSHTICSRQQHFG